MPNRWLRAVIFDFDGVLVDSEPLHFLAFHEVLKRESIELTEAEYYEHCIGVDDRGSFRAIYQTKGLELVPKVKLRLLARKSQVMRELIQNRKPKALPGAAQLVRGLWRHYPLAICSGALRDEIEIMLEGISLRDCFEVIVSSEDVTVGKPDPQGYLLALEKLAAASGKTIKPEDCLIVEDAPSVIERVKEVGFKTLGVATTRPMSMLAMADYSVSNLEPDLVRSAIRGLKVVG
jgi:HAD superfamily hydrolase (TIGR01509 family)